MGFQSFLRARAFKNKISFNVLIDSSRRLSSPLIHHTQSSLKKFYFKFLIINSLVCKLKNLFFTVFFFNYFDVIFFNKEKVLLIIFELFLSINSKKKIDV